MRSARTIRPVRGRNRRTGKANRSCCNRSPAKTCGRRGLVQTAPFWGQEQGSSVEEGESQPQTSQHLKHQAFDPTVPRRLPPAHVLSSHSLELRNGAGSVEGEASAGLDCPKTLLSSTHWLEASPGPFHRQMQPRMYLGYIQEPTVKKKKERKDKVTHFSSLGCV